jgi:type II secretion system protein C
MKQRLWILNSLLFLIFLFSIVAVNFLRQEPKALLPKDKKVVATNEETEKKKDITDIKESWDQIFKNDIFGTFVPPQEASPAKKDLVSATPEPSAAEVIPAPELVKQDFVAPLEMNLNGIVVAADENRSVAMIEDETKKESLYHLGDKIKDAQIIRITRNRLVLLRANGQQEVFCLRKDDSLLEDDTPDKWKYVVKKIEENVYELDPQSFKKEVDSLGNFMEMTSVVGTAFRQGKPFGIRIGEISENDIGAALGLQKNDIIISVDGLNISELKNRLKSYDSVVGKRVGNEIDLVVNREDNDIPFKYRLVKIDKSKKKLFSPEKKKDAEEDTLKMSELQKREKQIQEFKQRHGKSDNQQQDAIAQIRQRLLENLKSRLQNSRIR